MTVLTPSANVETADALDCNSVLQLLWSVIARKSLENRHMMSIKFINVANLPE